MFDGLGKKKGRKRVVHESLDDLDKKEVKEEVQKPRAGVVVSQKLGEKPEPVVAPGVIDPDREYVVDVEVPRTEVVKIKLKGRDIAAGLAQLMASGGGD